MVDTNTKQQLSDSTVGIMSQYNLTPDTWGNPQNTDQIKNKTNDLWESQGNATSTTQPTAPSSSLSDILGRFQTDTNVCNGAEQTANSWLQTWQQYENSYVGSEQGIEQNINQENTAFVAATKPV